MNPKTGESIYPDKNKTLNSIKQQMINNCHIPDLEQLYSEENLSILNVIDMSLKKVKHRENISWIQSNQINKAITSGFVVKT